MRVAEYENPQLACVATAFWTDRPTFTCVSAGTV
jgi:hypothetical protein